MIPTGYQRTLALVALTVCSAALFFTGIAWGLPSRRADAFLFGYGPPWSGAKVMSLAGERSDDSNLGVDVSRHLLTNRNEPQVLNGNDADRAQLIRRYRLYTNQPDEVSVLMSIGRMRPGKLDLDPRYYQYGGAFMYPVAALLKAASIGPHAYLTLKPDVAWYVDHPDQFGRFYVVARAWSALWGVVGVWAVFGIARRFTGGVWLPAAAGLAFALMPVAINGAHEAKPHLQGATLELLAVMAAQRYVESGRRSFAWLAGALCGAAFGSVLSALLAFAILPVMVVLRAFAPSPPYSGERAGVRGPVSRRTAASGQVVRDVEEPLTPDPSPLRTGERGTGPLLHQHSIWSRVRICLLACAVGALVYVATNPYVAINLVRNREVLRSNLGNTRGMYHVGGWASGVPNALRLIGAGASPGLAAAGAVVVIAAGVVAVRRRRVGSLAALLAAPFVPIALQYFSVAAGKPGEYGRFALYLDAVLAIAAICGVARCVRQRWLARGIVFALLVATGISGLRYVEGFTRDARGADSRWAAAAAIARLTQGRPCTIAVWAEPAPYAVPPLDLFGNRLVILPPGAVPDSAQADVFVRAVDDPRIVEPWEDAFDHYDTLHGPPTPLSWANKPIVIDVPRRILGAP